MSGDDYMLEVLERHEVDQEKVMDLLSPVVNSLKDIYRKFGLKKVEFTGSIHSQMANTVSSDVDLILRFSTDIDGDFKKVRSHIKKTLKSNFSDAQERSESVRLHYNQMAVDVMPTIEQKQWDRDYGLYVCDMDGVWHTTNIDLYHRLMSHCDVKNEINLVKIWLKQHNLHCPSMYLELLMVDYFNQHTNHGVSANVLRFLKYLGSKEWESISYYDPGNPENRIDNLINKDKKRAISAIARNSASKVYWHDVIK